MQDLEPNRQQIKFIVRLGSRKMAHVHLASHILPEARNSSQQVPMTLITLWASFLALCNAHGPAKPSNYPPEKRSP